MRFRITHRTTYRYAQPVHESFNEVRLQPRSSPTQACLGFDLSVEPPTSIVTFNDYYGNIVHTFSVPYLHDELTIEAVSEVATFAGMNEPLGGPRDASSDESPALEALRTDELLADTHAEFLAPSTYVALEPASAELAEALLRRHPSVSAYAFLLAATADIRERFTYQLGVTNVQSTVADVIQGGRGVCQDFAHVLLAICRQVGIPARYVSGYIGNVASSSASHAWVEAFVPPYGWLGVDPTAGLPCTGRHVKVAIGRDYADVTVVRGSYRGESEATLDVSVRSEMREDAPRLYPGLETDSMRERGRLVQYQVLGSMQQKQRLGAMRQSFATFSQSRVVAGSYLVQHPEPDAPRQQPQQQQQAACRAERP
ncbi:MAG: transglutaminase family protein [Chloroflexi bacterium]|nr:MAG: transglutaminase family protein [Chloroflexota bacterium]